MEWQEKRGVIVRHQALYTYNQAMKSYMSRYKFVGDYYLRYAFTEEFKTFLKPLMKNYRLVPVPVSPDTMKKRGFNQVIGFLEGAGLPYYSLFAKEDSHIKQSSRNRSERLLASHGFHLIDKVNLPKQVLLVDDIYTTGVTLNTLRALLFNAGVYDIRSFSLAR
jgi:competence protein ComFC